MTLTFINCMTKTVLMKIVDVEWQFEVEFKKYRKSIYTSIRKVTFGLIQQNKKKKKKKKKRPTFILLTS